LHAPRRLAGEVLMSPTRIQGVGIVAFVADPSGNPIGFMQHE
jgi:predicted enzyme related to lactoylglutathione lyase